MLSISTSSVTKASRNSFQTGVFASLGLNSNSRRPSRRKLLQGKLVNTSRGSHNVALAVNSSSDFFTSTIPSDVSQRVKPIGFDEEPCTLGLTDGYSYAEIEIGDRVGACDRYRVVRKLGWGLFATAWLVEDLQNNTYAALKVLNHYATLLETGAFGDSAHPRFYERDILSRISQPTTAMGAQHCMQLLDSFHIKRRTGEHLCLVQELGGMSLEDMRPLVGNNYSMPTQFVKSVIKQLCLGLSYLHSDCGVVHTDLKPSNILVSFSPEDTRRLVDSMGSVERYPPRRVLGETIQALRSQPLPLPSFDNRNPFTWVFKITDFGSAQWIGQRSTNAVQPVRLRSPEVVLGHDWNEKIDVWSLGCLTFEFLTGRTLFRAQGGANWKEEDDLLANHLELLSLTQFPSYFYQNSRYALYHLKEDGSLKNIPGRMLYPKTLADALARHKHAPINADDSSQERDLALAFIARCLTLDPRDRPSAAQLLSHPWIRNFDLGKPLPIPAGMRLNGEAFGPQRFP